MRLFTAICLGDGERRRAGRALELVRAAAEKGRFTRPENLHITLVFLGETGREQAARRALEGIAFAPFALALSGLGRFPKKGGDVLWMGAEDSAPLRELHRRVREALEEQGFSPQAGPYRPHLTLGRGVRMDPGLDRGLERLIPPVELRVERVSLLLSHRVEGRLTYTRLFEREPGPGER